MAEQPHQWRDRTLEVPPQDPWAHPPVASGPTRSPGSTSGPTSGSGPTPRPGTTPSPTPSLGPAQPNPFHRGVAHVKPAMPRTESFTAAHEPTGTGWPEADAPEQRRPVGAQLRQLRLGGEWSAAAALFAFVCWGVWTLSTDGDSLMTPVLVFGLTLMVAVGLFALSRLLGRIVLEKQLNRVRRTARGAHLVTAVFLTGVGLAFLRQTDWVMSAWNWVAGTF